MFGCSTGSDREWSLADTFVQTLRELLGGRGWDQLDGVAVGEVEAGPDDLHGVAFGGAAGGDAGCAAGAGGGEDEGVLPGLGEGGREVEIDAREIADLLVDLRVTIELGGDLLDEAFESETDEEGAAAEEKHGDE